MSVRLLALLLITALPSFAKLPARAQESDFTLTAEQVANPPERDLEFEESSIEVQRRLPRPDPSLLQKKVIATFTFKLPPQTAHDSNLKELNQLQDLGHGLLLFPHHSGVTRLEFDPLGGSLRRILDATPEDRRPPAAEMEFLKAVPVDVYTQAQQDPEDRNVFKREFAIFAETPEQARTNVAALLKILDNGLTRSYQVELFERRAKLLNDLENEQKAFDQATADHAKFQKEAAEVANFPADLLPSLRVQQLQLEVDLAGTKSRIEACEKLLQGDQLKSAERQAKVIDLKTAAEVDLASFEARQKTISQFVEKAKRSAELNSLLAANGTARSSHRRQLHLYQSQVRSLEKNIIAFQPLPLLGKIQIQPLKWTQ